MLDCTYFFTQKIKLDIHILIPKSASQKQPFANNPQDRCSLKFRKTHRKTHLLQPFLNKVASLRPATLLKKKLQNKCFPLNIEQITGFFYKTPLVASSRKTNLNCTHSIMFSSIKTKNSTMAIFFTKHFSQRWSLVKYSPLPNSQGRV